MRRYWALFSLMVLTACSGSMLNPEPLRVSIAELQLKRLGLVEQRYEVALRVANPNAFDLRIEAVDFELEVNQRPFARGLTRVTTLIEARSNSVVRLDAFTASNALLAQLRALTPSGLRAGVAYRIHGRVKVDASARWLPFDARGVYGAPAVGGQKKS